MRLILRALDFILACILFLFGGLFFIVGWAVGYVAVAFSWASELVFTLSMRTIIQRWPKAEREAAEREIEELENA